LPGQLSLGLNAANSTPDLSGAAGTVAFFLRNPDGKEGAVYATSPCLMCLRVAATLPY